MKLTDTKIKQAKPKDKEYPLTDGHGLNIIIKPNGKKYWVHRFMFEGKRKPMHLGVYPTLSLKEARAIHNNNRVLIGKGINPKELKANEKNARKLEVSNTFKSVVEKYFHCNG